MSNTSESRRPLQREEVHKGLLVRLLSQWITVPSGTTGTVDEVGTLGSGEWCFTVYFDRYVAIPLFPPAKTTRPKIKEGGTSTRLWASHLGKFEVITPAERDAATSAFDDLHTKKTPTAPVPPRHTINQLPLPFDEHYQVVRGTRFFE